MTERILFALFAPVRALFWVTDRTIGEWFADGIVAWLEDNVP